MTAHDRAAELAEANDWHKSSYSGGQNGGCVEVGTAGPLVGVRDTVLGSRSPVLVFARESWTAFIRSLPQHPGPDTASVTPAWARGMECSSEGDRQVSHKPGSELDPATLLWRRIGSGLDADAVEIAPLPANGWAMRNSADGPDGPVLHFTSREWNAFSRGVRDGEFGSIDVYAR